MMTSFQCFLLSERWIRITMASSPRTNCCHAFLTVKSSPYRTGGKFPVLPNMKALDTNVDGELDANEIANAPAALKTLDKNTDGKLTWDEYMSPPPTDLDGNDGPPPGRQ